MELYSFFASSAATNDLLRQAFVNLDSICRDHWPKEVATQTETALYESH